MAYTFEDPAERERRRWMRENAHLYIRHDAHRFLRPDAPGWVHPDHKLWNPYFRYREEPQPHRSRAAAAVVESRMAERGEQVRRSRPSTSEILKLKSDLAALRVHLAVIRHENAIRKARGLPPLTEGDDGWQIILKSLARFQADCRKAGFNPAQPRVPAGNSDCGQWTSGVGAGDAGGGTGGGINDPRVISDATPDNTWIPGERYAQNDPLDDRIDLSENTHVMRQHVRSPEYVLRRVREISQRAEELGDDFEGLRAGSFSSLEAANKLMNSTLAQNQTVVDQVAVGAREGARIEARFGAPTGYEAYIARPYSQAELRDTYAVRIVIQNDPLARRGFRVITAFPIR